MFKAGGGVGGGGEYFEGINGNVSFTVKFFLNLNIHCIF